MHTQTEENYLKTIYHLSRVKESPVNTSQIASQMDTSAASVTDMLKRLSEKSLIEYERYKGVRITRKGEQVAVDIVRRHRLWEVFLTSTLHFGWDEVHSLAEQLEHIKSDELVTRLDAFLGHPQFDPHGDPIPDGKGNIPQQNLNMLSNGKTKEKYIITGVSEHSPAFLRFLDRHGLRPGITLRIAEIQEYDQSMKITLGRNEHIYLSHAVTQQILVAPHGK